MNEQNKDVDFVIESVEMKPGKTRRFLHNLVEGAKCCIGDVELFHRGFIWYYDEEKRKWSYIHTSSIQSVKRTENDEKVDITTDNTIYHLRRTNYDPDTYRGVVQYTVLNAKQDVMDYCKENGITINEQRLTEATEFLYFNMKGLIWPHDEHVYLDYYFGIE